jgi:hypothetical protein
MPPYYKQGSFDYLEEKWFEDYYRIRVILNIKDRVTIFLSYHRLAM